jgi:PqqD family protein of HPr-rel-A system
MLAGEDESVIYNDLSGETHLLSALAISLLLQLQQSGPAEGSTIAARLADTWEFESDDEARQMTCSLLAELDTLGLIKHSPS